jgi:tRNA(Ile)-lysidine synthase
MLERMVDPSAEPVRGIASGSRLDRAFARELAAQGLRGRRVLVAVSGGRDSCVLLDLFRGAARDFALELVVGHVHHGLRGRDADLDADHVESLARAGALPFHRLRVDPEAARRIGPSRVRPSLEEAARDLRRAALARLADETGCAVIATAHHAGDQAETLLLRLLRGTGPDGLAGMAPRSADGRWSKPLLRVAPESIADWAARRALVWREDESNRDRRFARNRLRLDVLPELRAHFNPQLLRTLGDLAEATSTDRSWIEARVGEAAEGRVAWRDPVLHFVIDGWSALPDALARRVVLRGLVEAGLGREISRAVLLRVLAFLRRGRAVGRGKKVELPGGFLLRRVGDHFELSATTPNAFDADPIGTD